MVGTCIHNILRDGTPRDRRTSVLVSKLVQSIQSAKCHLCSFQSLACRRSSSQLDQPLSPRCTTIHIVSPLSALNLAQRPACSVSTSAHQSPGANAWHRSSNCFRVTLPPRGGRNKIILGRSMNNFHARWTLMKSPFASPCCLECTFEKHGHSPHHHCTPLEHLAHVYHVQTRHPHRNGP